MFDLLPDAFSKVGLRGALAYTALFSLGTGAYLGMLSMATIRLHVSRFDFLDMLIQTLLCGALAARFYFLTLERAGGQQSATSAR